MFTRPELGIVFTRHCRSADSVSEGRRAGRSSTATPPGSDPHPQSGPPHLVYRVPYALEIRAVAVFLGIVLIGGMIVRHRGSDRGSQVELWI